MRREASVAATPAAAPLCKGERREGEEETGGAATIHGLHGGKTPQDETAVAVAAALRLRGGPKPESSLRRRRRRLRVRR